MNAPKYPGMFAVDQRVVTTRDAGSDDWTPHARANRRWGVEGVVRAVSTGHGWCYLVEHEGSTAWYEHEELREPGSDPSGDDARGGVTTSVVPGVVADGEEQKCVVCLKGGELRACIECGDRMHHKCSAMWGIGVGHLCWICREPWKKKERIRSRREEIAKLQREIEEEGHEEKKMEPFEIIEYAGETYRVSLTITGRVGLARQRWRWHASLDVNDGRLSLRGSNWNQGFVEGFVPYAQERYDMHDGDRTFVVDSPFGRLRFSFSKVSSTEQAERCGMPEGEYVGVDYEIWEDVGAVGVLHHEPDEASRMEDCTLVYHLRCKVLKAAIKLAADDRVFSEPQESFGGFR